MVDPVFTDDSQPPPAGPFVGVPAAVPPAPLTSFIGREGEVAAVVSRLRQPDLRLLTLTGPGGIGKTRLALRVIESVRNGELGKTAWASLAPVRAPDHVAATIAQALNLSLVAGQSPWEQVQVALASSRLLLVLDNLEQVSVGVASPLASLLGRCPGLTVLATSRVPLRVSGEQVLPVSPLSPGSARELFAVRASAVDPSLTVTDDTFRTIDAICSRLDRLPLAIELAAARVPVLTPAALLTRLDRRLEVLTGGPRDVDHRLRSMRESIAWSHDLLPPSCRLLFRRLGVFPGGFTFEGAAAVGDEGADVLEDLTGLMTASLVVRVPRPDAEPRYTMLETIREFAVEQLESSGEGETIRQRHAWHMVRMAERLWGPAGWPEIEHWLRRLQPEIDNFRAALEWSLGREPVQALRLAGSLDDYWIYFGYQAEGWDWITRASTVTADAPAWIRVRVLVTTARLALERQDYDRAESLVVEAIAVSGGELDAHLEYKLMEIPRLAALQRGDLERARRLFMDEHDRAQRAGSLAQLAVARMNLGQVELATGDPAQAEALLKDALALHGQGSSLVGVAFGQFFLAEAQVVLGKAGEAFGHFRDAFAAFADARFRVMAVACLDEMAEVAVVSQPGVAVLLLAMAETIPADILGGRREQDMATRTRILATARAALEEPEFRAAWEQGVHLDWSDIRAVVETLPSSVAGLAVRSSGDGRHGLTPRELDVLRLVAAGRSNREIANALYISIPTVKRHLTTIFGKLQVSSRSAAAAYAHAYDLLATGRRLPD